MFCIANRMLRYRRLSWVAYVMCHQRQVPDVFPVLAAAHKALLSKARESLTTRTLHSELVYNISGSKHVISLATVAFAFYEVAVTEYVDGLSFCTDIRVPEEMWHF
jgi:hypothetical protein